MKIQYKPEVTFGNLLQIASILATVIGYLIHNEVRAAKMENQIATHESRIEHCEAAIIKK